MIRVVQILCIVVTAAILYGIGKSLDLLSSFFEPGFDAGFVFGMAFCVLVYLFIIWIDPSSRPRGTSAKQD